MAKGIARGHHYVPDLYLRGFGTLQPNETHRIVAVDRTTGKVFSPSTEGIAKERDYNRIDIDGMPPDALEKALAEVEGQIAPGLARIIAARSIADDGDRELLLNLLGMMAFRNPRHRQNIGRFEDETLKIMLEMMYADRGRYEAMRAAMRAAGRLLEEEDEASFEDMQRFVKEGEFEIGLDQNWTVGHELEALTKLMPLLFERKWSLVRAAAGSGGFITSDHPVVLRWSKPELAGGFYGPGYGMRDTEVLFPLSPDLAVCGTFEANPVEVDLPLQHVAYLNGITAAYSRRQVYARDLDFQYMRNDSNQAIVPGSELASDPAFLRHAGG